MNARLKSHAAHLLAVAAGALLLSWPALLNRYPLLYADSIGYIGGGRPLAHSLFVHRLPTIGAMRSEMYCLGIFPWHWNVTPWPIVALQGLLTAMVLWWVVRSILGRGSVGMYLGVVAFLSVFTSASWYVSLIMPDIFGPLLYLCIYLLVFARETLSKPEHWAVAILAWWATMAHSTHLLIAAVLIALLAMLLLFRWPPMQRNARALAEGALILILAAGTQFALHGYLYGKPSLNGNRPPYLMARIVADGPGRLYLQKNCGHLNWAICDRVGDLPDNDDEFLWADGGVWSSASPATQARLLQEEMPLVLATVRAYPRQQAAASWANVREQFNDFGVDDFDNNTWMEGALESVMPGGHARYIRSLQANDRVPVGFFTALQRWVVVASAVGVVVLAWPLWRRRELRLLGLTAVIVCVVLVNPVVTAVLSSIDSRYQSRVIWLVPLLAVLSALSLMLARKRPASLLPA
jgi:hypothetical protein